MSNVTREIRIDAPAPRVWRHLTDPARRRRWFGGDLEVDLSPGEQGTFVAPGEDDRPVRVDDVEDGRSVTFTWGADDAASQVRIEVEPDGDGSRVTVTETPAGAEEASPPAAPEGPPVALFLPGGSRRDGLSEIAPDAPHAVPGDGEVAPSPGGLAPAVPFARAA